MNTIFVTTLNIILITISIVLATKSSEIPFFLGDGWLWFSALWEKFSSGNSEIFSISSSIIAAYIFYFINAYIPNNLKRGDALKQISPQITQIIYRAMCLTYIHRNLRDKLDASEIMNLYKIIIHDLDKKTGLIPWFSDILTMSERNAIYSFQANKDKFLMNHRKLDEISETLSLAAISLATGIKLPSAHTNDIIWFKIENKSICFLKDSNIFKLFMLEIFEYNKDIALKIPDFMVFINQLIQTQSTQVESKSL